MEPSFVRSDFPSKASMGFTDDATVAAMVVVKIFFCGFGCVEATERSVVKSLT